MLNKELNDIARCTEIDIFLFPKRGRHLSICHIPGLRLVECFRIRLWLYYMDTKTRNFGQAVWISKYYPQADNSKQEHIFEHFKAILFESYLTVLIHLIHLVIRFYFVGCEPMPICIGCSNSYIEESLVILRNGMLLVMLKKSSEIILDKSFSNQISYWVSSLK